MTLFQNPTITPIEEIAAYETLWENKNASFKNISKLFEKNPGNRPTNFVDTELNQQYLTNN